jgi:hypothetical protein
MIIVIKELVTKEKNLGSDSDFSTNSPKKTLGKDFWKLKRNIDGMDYQLKVRA